MSTSTVKDSFTVAKGWRKRGAGRIKLMNTTQTQVRSTVEALKMALEALKICYKDCYIPVRLTREAITAIKEALAQQNPQGVSNEQVEPVAFLTNHRQRMNVQIKPEAFVWMPTTTDWEVPLYITPPQRPSRSDIKPLTDKQVREIAKQYALSLAFPYGGKTTPEMFARAIEAAHGIRPTDFKE